MDLSLVTSILGVILTIFGTSVAIFALDESRRAELVRFWKKWLTVVFVIVVVVNSAAGLYGFLRGPAQIVRSDVIAVLIHLFNLLSIPVILFMSAMFKALDHRNAKRLELVAMVEAMGSRIEALSTRHEAKQDAQVPTGASGNPLVSTSGGL